MFMRKTIVMLAVALAGCQAEPAPENKVEPLPPMGSGPLQDREFAMPLLGIVKAGDSAAVIKLDKAKNQFYFASNVRGKVSEESTPFVKPGLMNTSGQIETKNFTVRLNRFDCKSPLGTSTITALVSPKVSPGTGYTLCLIADWPKDTKIPSWAKVPQ